MATGRHVDPGSYDAAVSERDVYVAWFNLVRVSASVRSELDRAIARETGIGLSEDEVLFRLVHAPGQRARMSDLAERLCMAQSGITRVVDRLVERGLVVRETRPDNRRTVDARLTPAGRKTFERARPEYMRIIRDRFGRGLTAREGARLRVALRSVLEGLGTGEEVPWAECPPSARQDATTLATREQARPSGARIRRRRRIALTPVR